MEPITMQEEINGVMTYIRNGTDQYPNTVFFPEIREMKSFSIFTPRFRSDEEFGAAFGPQCKGLGTSYQPWSVIPMPNKNTHAIFLSINPYSYSSIGWLAPCSDGFWTSGNNRVPDAPKIDIETHTYYCFSYKEIDGYISDFKYVSASRLLSTSVKLEYNADRFEQLGIFPCNGCITLARNGITSHQHQCDLCSRKIEDLGRNALAAVYARDQA